MLDWLDHLYNTITGWLFEAAIQPAMYALGLMDWADDAFHWLDFAFFGLVQVVVVYAICRPLEAWRPVERWDSGRAVRTDIVYTMLARLGLLPLIAFVVFASIQARWEGLVADSGFVPPTLESLFPWLRDHSAVAFLVYVVILDFGEYWHHRFQHGFRWWWALHSLHHAQRQMTFWTDDRNHLIDDVIQAAWFGGLALLIGVPPGQFPLLVLVLRLAESLSHANVRLSFGPVGERILVSPRFHRVHHGILSVGEKGRNYATLFPAWDWIFGTADFRRGEYPRTGDPDGPEAMATGGWLRTQYAGLRRLAGTIAGRPAPRDPGGEALPPPPQGR